MHDLPETLLDASGMRIGIAVSRYHFEITDPMRQAAVDAFVRAGGHERNLVIVPAAGAFELTAICRALAIQAARNGRPAFDAVIALGCVITGQTAHDQYLAQSVTHGLTLLTVETGMPIAFGVLTCKNVEQARERITKGSEAMSAAIETVATLRNLRAKAMR